MNFSGKKVLITGANRGTGLCIAETFLEQEGEIFVHSINKGDSEKTVKDLGSGVPLWGDLTTDDGCKFVLAEFKKKSSHLSILVNNFGGASPGKWMGNSSSTWIDSYQTNTLSAVRMIENFLPIMKSGGRVINIGTIGSTRPGKSMPHYYSAKAALGNLTSSLAKETGFRNITTNLVSPGLIRTEEVETHYLKIAKAKGWGNTFDEAEKKIVEHFSPNPIGRIATRLEIANVVLFLASPMASFINGQNIKVDGGALDLI
ncbi:MAG: 3-oxoacyl-ACP reductase [Gammaproteobacteria bacterium]|nr:3-oxoacyl-ACP reductase [Gammaproteobacteria bacterium]